MENNMQTELDFSESNIRYDYLNLLERKLDEQQLKACCRLENCVVAAGAGSGKTQVLATRFAWLVMEFDEITAPSILTLTFTKKAAAEMYQRIYETLSFFAVNQNVPARQRKNAKRALDEFANVHIQTLDSYCGSVLKQCANRYGIRPDFSTGSSDSESNVKEQALKFVLRNRNRIGIKYYSQAGKLQSFAEDVFADIILKCTSIATSKNYFSFMLSKQEGHVIKRWNEIVTSISGGSLRNIVSNYYSCIDAIENNPKIDPNYKDEVDLLTERKKLEKIKLEDFSISEDMGFEKNLPDIISKMNAVKNYLDSLFPVKTLNRTGAFKEVKAVISQYKILQKELESIYSYGNSYECQKDLYILLDEFLEIVNEQKRTTGALTFADVTEMALKVLIEQRDVRSQEKQAFSKIMIDEFQDNNGKNRDLLFLLSENLDVYTELDSSYMDPDAVHRELKSKILKDKLFFVGDEKQSIYKFRGADVSVFNELRNDLAAIAGKDSSLMMINNYRSDQVLLESFNQIFGGYSAATEGYKKVELCSVFDNTSEAAYEALYPEAGIARYVDRETHQEKSLVPLTKENVKTHMCVFVPDEEHSNMVKRHEVMDTNDQLSYFVATKIKELHDAGAEYSDIAILEKRRTNRKFYTQWLERFEIPYALDQQANIFDDAVVNDIYSFLRLCVYPSDLNAYCSFMCSPLVGLLESDVEMILARCVNIEDYNFVFVPFDQEHQEEILEAFGKDSVESKRYLAAKEFFEEWQPKVLSQPVTKTLNMLWYSRGYCFETMLDSRVSLFEDQFNLLFEIARTADEEGKSVAWLVDQLAIQKNKETSGFSKEDPDVDFKEVSYPSEKQSAVQILTIHKSKGLQYKYVFLLDSAAAIGKEKKGDYFFSEEYGVSVNPADGSINFFFLKMQEEENKKNVAEFRRLIYVGATRAEKELWFINPIKLPKDYKREHLFKNIVLDYYPDFQKEQPGIYFNGEAPFDYQRIEMQPHYILNDFAASDNETVDSLRANVIGLLSTMFENCSDKMVSMPQNKYLHISPSELEKMYDSAAVENSSGNHSVLSAQSELYPEIDELIGRINEVLEREEIKMNYGLNDFGTLVHKSLECGFLGIPFDSSSPEVKKLVKNLNANHVEQLETICKKINGMFYSTELGKSALDSKNEGRLAKSEYEFKSFVQGYLIKGSMDLVFESSDGSLTIVDYKTDHEIVPEKYYGQQTCYRKALSEITGVPESSIRVQLYYVRYNQTVDITDSASIELTADIFRTVQNEANGDENLIIEE